MSLTYDQRSEIRMAFDEAFVEPERRRSARIKHQVPAEVFEWKRGKLGASFGVQIDDFSPSGAGFAHHLPLPVGMQYLLRIPRPESDELLVLLTVVRCLQQAESQFQIGLEISSVMTRTAKGQLMDAINDGGGQVTSRRTKLLFLVLGISGIGVSLMLA